MSKKEKENEKDKNTSEKCTEDACENKEEKCGECAEQEADNSAVEKLEQELKAKNDAYLATANAIKEILPIGDSLDMAAKSVENAPEEYKKGFELMCSQFRTSLEKLGVETFGETGDEFDPKLHNAVMKVEDESLGENTVAQVFQKGYKKGDKIIRHAMVQVANCD